MNLLSTVLKIMKEDVIPSSSTTTSSIPTDTPIVKQKSDGKALGCDYFDCDFSDFNNAMTGRKKNQKFKTFLNKNTDLTKKVRQFRKENPKKDLLLRSTRDGSFVFANRGSR